MEAIKKIIEHSTHELIIELPKSYQNKKLEVIVLTIEEEVKNKKNMIFLICMANRFEGRCCC